MTDKPQPDKFDWATELSDAEAHVSLSKQEAHEIGARLRSMGAKLKTYEDLGDAGSDVQLLRMGYAAARLEIESLRKKHADELTVAYLCGASRGKELAAQQPGAAYAALPDGVATLCEYGGDVFTAAQMRAFADATCALRATPAQFARGFEAAKAQFASHGQAPAQAAPASVLHLVHSAFAEIAMAFPKAFALHKVGIADTAVREALAAPAAVAGPSSEAVAYLDIGTGGYLDLGTDMAYEALSRLPKGRHALVIAGTYGIDGYTAAPTTQPSPRQEPHWWRKWADEIEVQVASTGSKEAMRCYTDMRTLLQAAACDTPHYCNSVQRCTAQDEQRAKPSPAAQGDALSDDAVRVPLDSLHADAAYLIGRLREGSMPYARVIEIIRERIDAAKAAIRARAEQGDALDAACQRACMELPEGMSMAIQLERHAGWIDLHGSYGDQIELPNADGSLAEQVHQAIDVARAAQEGKSHDE